MSVATDRESLGALGFRPRETGSKGAFVRDGLLLERDGVFWTLSAPGQSIAGDCFPGALGRPGLWRPVGDRLLFEVPPLESEGASDGALLEPSDDERGALALALQWGLATLRGEVPEGWSAPPPTLVEQLLEPGALLVSKNGQVATLGLVCSERRLVLTFEHSLPSDRTAARGAWIAATLVDASRRWRLVRAALAGAGLRAEIDLSGVPRSVLPSLLAAAKTSLRSWVQWSFASFTLLGDNSFRAAILDRLLPVERPPIPVP